VFSRLGQIRDNYRNKSTGTLSFFMCFLNFMGVVARIFTTLVELNDKLVLGSLLVAVCINGVIVLQILYYWKNKQAIKTE